MKEPGGIQRPHYPGGPESVGYRPDPTQLPYMPRPCDQCEALKERVEFLESALREADRFICEDTGIADLPNLVKWLAEPVPIPSIGTVDLD